MQTNFQKDLIGAHANGLKSQIHALEVQVTILKQLITGGKAAAAAVDEEEEETEVAAAAVDEEEEELAAKPKPKKKAAANFGDEEEEDEEPAAAPAKAAKAKKITADQVNDACKAHAAENGIKATKALLLKKFKTASITEIDSAKYGEVLKAMEV